MPHDVTYEEGEVGGYFRTVLVEDNAAGLRHIQGIGMVDILFCVGWYAEYNTTHATRDILWRRRYTRMMVLCQITRRVHLTRQKMQLVVLPCSLNNKL